MAIREAQISDVQAMAALAEAKRQHYRDHAAPFQRPASNGREVHERFLPKLLEWEAFTVLVHEGGEGVDGFVVARFGSAPPPYGEGSWFHVDDFVVGRASLWASVGRELLDAVMNRAREAGIDQAIVVCGPSSIDEPKVAFLSGTGLRVDAEWRVKPLALNGGDPPGAPRGFEAAIAPAPPVYDPGGPTALAVRIEPGAVARFEEFGSASGAVVGIVPVRISDEALRAELDQRGFVVASEWYSGPVAAL
jgi:N-acetylglutamate synthase-like GNAT family acetyltransferase